MQKGNFEYGRKNIEQLLIKVSQVKGRADINNFDELWVPNKFIEKL
jgi:hypothetical protein